MTGSPGSQSNVEGMFEVLMITDLRGENLYNILLIDDRRAQNRDDRRGGVWFVSSVFWESIIDLLGLEGGEDSRK